MIKYLIVLAFLFTGCESELSKNITKGVKYHQARKTCLEIIKMDKSNKLEAFCKFHNKTEEDCHSFARSAEHADYAKFLNYMIDKCAKKAIEE